MGITGSQHALMYARANLARSCATRSGYYNETMPVTIAGVDVSSKIWRFTTRIEKLLNELPDQAGLDVFGIDPIAGQRIIIGSGAINNRLFGGVITLVKQKSVKKAAKKIYTLTCVDWTHLLGKRKVWKSYAGQQAHLIFLDLIATYAAADGFTGSNVMTSSPVITNGIDFSGEDLPAAFTRLVRLASSGGTPWNWYVDAYQDIHLFDVETTQLPTPLTTSNFQYEQLSYDQDITQVVTRAIVVGGGGATTAPVAIGSTTIPVDECRWYTGTETEIGPQRVTYTGRSATSGPGNLTGVPAVGAGSVVSAIPQGTNVNILVQVDDAAAQAALAAIEGGDGVHERIYRDGRWNMSTCTQTGTAQISLFKAAVLSGTYLTRDIFSDVGKAITITLAPRGISLTVPIQKVVITRVAQDRWQRNVDFNSSVRLSLVDALRSQATSS